MADNPVKSIFGQFLGIGARGNLVGANGRNLTEPAAHVTGTISAEAATVADQRDISLIVKDINGNAINYVAQVELHVFASSAMLDWSAGGSTGIAAGANGKILALVAKKIFRAQTTAAGLLDVIYTDTATAAAYLAVRLPNGRLVGIGTLTNA